MPYLRSAGIIKKYHMGLFDVIYCVLIVKSKISFRRKGGVLPLLKVPEIIVFIRRGGRLLHSSSINFGSEIL